jgi:bla regulator protein blaR1
MTRRALFSLSPGKKLLLAGASLVAIGLPVAVGILNTPQIHAQAAAPPLSFEMATVEPGGDGSRRMIQFVPGGGLRVTGATLKFLLAVAYNVLDVQISGGPAWINSDHFNIVAKSERGESESAPDDIHKMTDAQMKTSVELIRQKLQALLADRFQLTLHHESKEQPVYRLVIGKDGPKLQESLSKQERHMMMGRGELSGDGAPFEMLVSNLSSQLGRPVIDRTGLTGHYDFKLQWAPDSNGPSIFTAIQEQLGLRLESERGPVDILVIDRAEKPSEN